MDSAPNLCIKKVLNSWLSDLQNAETSVKGKIDQMEQ